MEFTIPTKISNGSQCEWSKEPVRKVLIVGHGAIAKRQFPTHKHWISKGVEVHCVDIDRLRLEACPPEFQRYAFPNEIGKLTKLGPSYFDLILVNNVPELHIITALELNTYAKRIIIQKPQDLNFPLIRTVANAVGYENFLKKTKIHDHYRNKGAVPALLKVLSKLHTHYGQFKRMMFLMTESCSVNEEVHRLASLKCGAIHDMGVHMCNLLFECIPLGMEWRDTPQSERIHRRIGGKIKVAGCEKWRMQNSMLGDTVETFAAIDLQITEYIEFPSTTTHAQEREHTFDVLILVGKGLDIEQGVTGDLKVVIAEFERESYEALIDLSTQGTMGITNLLPQLGEEINKQHGGLNRPLFLLSPDPPEHALRGLGGNEKEYEQFLDFRSAWHVAAFVEGIRSKQSSTPYMGAYPAQRPVVDLLRQLVGNRTIRQSWGDIRPLVGCSIRMQRPDEYYD